MDSQAQASFIPKKTLATERGPKRGFGGLVMLVSILVFLASLITAAGAFGYEKFLEVAINSKKESLAKYEAAFDISTIQTLVRFDSRITHARELLNKHTAPSGIFFFLSEQTLAKVQFTSFQYDLQDDGTAKIKLSGVANSFNTVALQSDQFGASKVLKDVIFSGLQIETDGSVSFTVDATVDPSLILYSKNMDNAIPVTASPSSTQPDAASAPAEASSTSALPSPAETPSGTAPQSSQP